MVYGKGGLIRKSTTLCNTSISLARFEKNVLQLGCNTKHYSYPYKYPVTEHTQLRCLKNERQLYTHI